MHTENLPREAVDMGLFGTGMLSGWQRKFEFGLNRAKGVSDNLNLRTAFNTGHEDEEDRWQFEMVYRFTESEKVSSQNRFYSNLNKDWLLPESDWFYFVTGRFDWDEFKDRKYRGSGFTGPGYDFWTADDGYFRGRAGIGGNRTFGATDDKFTLEALLGVEAGWQVSKAWLVDFKSAFYPSLSDVGEFRNITSSDWSHQLDYYEGLAFKPGIYNE